MLKVEKDDKSGSEVTTRKAMDVEVRFNRSRKKILYMHLELYVGLTCLGA